MADCTSLGLCLLDILAARMNCAYLSDLRYLTGWQRMRLVREIEKAPPGAATLFEWNDALEYLAQAPPQQTPEAARERLLTLLTQPRHAG